MPYEFTFWSKPYLAVAGKSTATFPTAAKALREYEGLVASDETVEIRDGTGREIGPAELRMLAEQEGQSA